MIQVLLRFYQDKFLSRWTVFSFDAAATFIALVFAIGLRFNFSVDEAQRILNVYSFSAVLLLYGLSFLIIGSHKGILRHTSLEDVRNVFLLLYLRHTKLSFFHNWRFCKSS